MKPEMTVTTACTDNVNVYVMLHKLGTFGSPGLQSLHSREYAATESAYSDNSAAHLVTS